MTAQTDVYGLGLLAYELLAGQPVFEGRSSEELVRKRLLGPPPSLRNRRIGVDGRVDAVLARALAVDPQRRYASAGAFADAFTDVAEGTGDDTTPLGRLPATRAPRRWSFPRFDSTVAVLAVLAVLLATALFFASFSRAGLSSPANPSATAAGRVSPNVVGKKLGDAVETLRGAGYATVAWDVGQGSGGSCAVVRQDPPAGTAITPNQTATLYYVAGKDCTKKGD